MSTPESNVPGAFTRAEIFQQPDTWPETLRRVREAGLKGLATPILTGAGTSCYAAIAIEAGWPGSRAVASTDLFLDFRKCLAEDGLVVSVARSGDSPESTAVVERIERAMPGVRHVALLCNPEAKLGRRPGVEGVYLDPRANDRSLVMTSAFSNLVVGGLALAGVDGLEQAMPVLRESAATMLEEGDALARRLAAEPPARMVVLTSSPMWGAAREACLKMLEITAGRVAAIPETFLGLRHGPLSFLQEESLVLCFISSDPVRRRYEYDLVRELRAKKLGRRIGIGAPDIETGLFEETVLTPAGALPDWVRTPSDIVFAQLLAYHLSIRCGLNPDNPSPSGIINHVVAGVTIYED